MVAEDKAKAAGKARKVAKKKAGAAKKTRTAKTVRVVSNLGKVVGIGGVFFRSPDPERLARWYNEALGLESESWESTRGTSFAPESMPVNAFTVWGVFARDTDYFGPSGQSFMINFVVDDLDIALKRVQLAGGEVLPHREEHDYGRFGWIIDPDGNRVELWEPPEKLPEPSR